MKIIFLDIDGVMIPLHSVGFPGDKLMYVGNMINDICKKQDADIKIVISSSWRNEGYNRCYTLLKTSGIDVDKFMFSEDNEYWKTSDIETTEISTRVFRYDEINTWLNKYREKLNIGSFVIIDDEYIPVLRAVKVDGYVGLTSENGEQIMKVLSE